MNRPLDSTRIGCSLCRLASLISGEQVDDRRRAEFVADTGKVFQRQPYSVRSQFLLQQMNVCCQTMGVRGDIITPNGSKYLFLREQLLLMRHKVVEQFELKVR